jgi:hypothetical protein
MPSEWTQLASSAPSAADFASFRARSNHAAAASPSCAASLGSGALEPSDIDVGAQLQQLTAFPDRLAAERAPSYVHGLVQVVRGYGGIAVAPEHVHQLLGVQPLLGPSESSLTSSRAFFRRHALSGTGSASTAAAKPPRSWILTSGIV